MLSKYKGKKVIVTGGAGFVGSNVADRLVELGATVTVLDDLCTGSPDNIDHLDKVNFIEGSVVDYDLVKKVLKGMDYIFHLAARNIIVSTRNPREDCETNIMGTLNILLSARELGLTSIPIVYSSSASVYGNPRHLPINEDDGVNTLTPYSVSKLAGENYCYAFYESYGLRTVIVRYSNVYGKGQSPENPYCGVVAKFFDNCAAGIPLKIHGDGEQTRDFTYVADTVNATLLAGVTPQAVGGIYNVGTGFETSVNKLAGLIMTLTDAPSEIEYLDLRAVDNIRRRVVNIEKIRRDIRWMPNYNIKSGLKKTQEWLNQKNVGQA